jgi:hypothetical protein
MYRNVCRTRRKGGIGGQEAGADRGAGRQPDRQKVQVNRQPLHMQPVSRDQATGLVENIPYRLSYALIAGGDRIAWEISVEGLGNRAPAYSWRIQTDCGLHSVSVAIYWRPCLPRQYLIHWVSNTRDGTNSTSAVSSNKSLPAGQRPFWLLGAASP